MKFNGLRLLLVTGLIVGLVLSVKGMALAPHPLDAAFETDDPAKAICDGDLFKQAISEANSAKRQAENNKAKTGPTPAQAARVRFIEVINLGK